ncbi:MAG: response regulator [Spirochaetales bacterium]|nr:response regulator [Spirochaetales bacterium]
MEKEKCILIVEDEAVNRIYFTRVLGKVGIKVDQAANGRDAVTKALANDYDLILMDLKMPLMDGIQATEAIREAEESRHTPIIALTSYSYPEDQQKCRSAGMDDFLSKPINNRLLLDKVYKFL